MARCPFAIWTPASPKNIGGPLGKVRLMVEHIEQGSESGTNSWFKNPAAQVSSHFGTGKDGQCYQFVDTDTIAWAEMNYNDVAISNEHEGFSGYPLTAAQMESDAKLGIWLFHTHNIPLVRTTNPNGSGWIGHGELGADGGGHLQCPGNPVLAQIPFILAKANAVLHPPLPKYPSPADLVSHGLVALHSGREARKAINNGWPLYGWNGLDFVPWKPRLLSGASQYASERWMGPNHTPKA